MGFQTAIFKRLLVIVTLKLSLLYFSLSFFVKYTALHKASSKGNLDVIELLVRRGASIDIRDNTGVCTWEEYTLNIFYLHAFLASV